MGLFFLSAAYVAYIRLSAAIFAFFHRKTANTGARRPRAGRKFVHSNPRGSSRVFHVFHALT
jgi:hypothetical protein